MLSTNVFRRSRALALFAAAGLLAFAPLQTARSQDQDISPRLPNQNENTAQQNNSRQQNTAQQPQQDGSQQTGDWTDHPDDESPALGVTTALCPGDAVCVTSTTWGSPAEEAGIVAGDYILSVDGQSIASPRALKETLHREKAGETVKLKLWRQGEEFEREVMLAAESKELPAMNRAWLGVMLSPTETNEKGVVIEQVIPGSPAEEAGLRVGETIVQINDNEVESVEKFVDCVCDYGPDTELNLTLNRDGTARQVAVKLGQVNAAPMRFLREAFQAPMQEGPMETIDDSLDDTLDEMRREIRALQQQVRELHGEKGQPNTRQEGNDQADSLEKGSLSVLPLISTLSPLSAITMVQQQSRGNGRYNHGSSRYNHGNSRYNYGNSHYNYGNSPYNYGNSYYSYGGKPYYYGGYRSHGYSGTGIRIGSNFGVYWY